MGHFKPRRLSLYLRLVPLPENPHVRPFPDKPLSVLRGQFYKCHSPETAAHIPRGPPVSLLHAPEGPDSVCVVIGAEA